MLGKASCYLAYITNAAKVYNIQRFPYNSYPVWGNAVLGCLIFIIYQRMFWNINRKILENDKYCIKIFKCYK